MDRSLRTLKTMATRVLATMFAFGLFNRPDTGSIGAVVTSPAHAAVAQTVSDEGTVLLRIRVERSHCQPASRRSPSLATMPARTP